MENAGLFGRLPGELRNKIYELVLIMPHFNSLVLVSYGKRSARVYDFGVTKDVQGRVRHADLLLTCRAIRAEALSVYYYRNVFLVKEKPNVHAYNFDRELKKASFQTLKQVHVRTEEWQMWKGKLERQIFEAGKNYVMDLVNAGQQDKRLWWEESFVKVTII